MRCPSCEKEGCTEITINLSGDDNLIFYSCRLCESKWWERGGDVIALDEVLSLTSQRDTKSS
ncbi:MAG: hypothetical protein ACR2KQ_01180 [Actinomycetota bacterium]